MSDFIKKIIVVSICICFFSSNIEEYSAEENNNTTEEHLVSVDEYNENISQLKKISAYNFWINCMLMKHLPSLLVEKPVIIADSFLRH